MSRALLPFHAVVAAGLLAGCATHRAIVGQVVDRNGEPMDRVIISLDPGGVETLTDSDGRFVIDYLRDETGERTKLKKRTAYTIEAFRTGYQVAQRQFYYRRGELLLEPIMMAEDTIRVQLGEESIDPGRYPDRSQSTGANYEGE